MQPLIKRLLWIAIILVVLAFIFYPRIKEDRNEKQAGGTKSGMQAPAVKVKTFIVKNSSLDNKVNSVGSIIAFEEVELRSEATGRVTKIYFTEGREVYRGQLLVKINDADLQAQLKKAQSNYRLAQDNEKRLKTLLDKEGISKADYDAALNQLNISTSDIEFLKEQIRKTEISAPFDGSIGLKYISDGSYINPSSRIAAIQHIQKVKVEFSISEKYVSELKVGNKINFTVQNNNKVYEANIYAIEPKIDPITRNVLLRAVCNNTDKKLFPGAFAEVELSLDKNEDAILIPSEAIVPQIKGKAVYLVKQGKAFSQPVQLGERLEKMVQITEGLNKGDTVIISGLLQVKPDAPVKIIGI